MSQTPDAEHVNDAPSNLVESTTSSARAGRLRLPSRSRADQVSAATDQEHSWSTRWLSPWHRALYRATTAAGVWNAVTLSTACPNTLRLPTLDDTTPRVTAATDGDIEALVTEGLGGLSESFIDEATWRGDRCYILRHDGAVAGFFWFTSGAALLQPGVTATAAPTTSVAYRQYIPRPFRPEADLRVRAVALAAQTEFDRGASVVSMFASPVDFNRRRSFSGAGLTDRCTFHLIGHNRAALIWCRGNIDELPCSLRTTARSSPMPHPTEEPLRREDR